MSFAKYQIRIPPQKIGDEPAAPWLVGWQDSIDWCEQRAVQGQDWWYLGRGVFEFACEQDAIMFSLRWA